MNHQTPSSNDASGSSKSLSSFSKWNPIMIARAVGILCVGGGFVLGIQGLDEPESRLLPTALGLIAAGLVAQIFALVRSCYLHANRTE